MKTTFNPLRRRFALAAIGIASALSVHGAVIAQSSFSSAAKATANSEPNNPNKHWVGTWATSPQPPFEGILTFPPAVPPTFSAQTLRQVVHTSIGGNRVRVRFSNTFGTTELTIGAARVGLRGGEANVIPGTNKALTFGGRSAVTIPAGALVVSDPVSLEVPALGDLAISMYLPNAVEGRTTHGSAFQTNYVLSGDQTGSTNPLVASTTQSYYFLTNVEVYAGKEVGAIVCLGDSITDGSTTTPNLNHRWPNFLAQRIMAQRGKKNDMGVLNQGIGGNRLLHNVIGTSALGRFDRDVIAQAGVTDIIVLEGINDIGFNAIVPSETVTAEDIIFAHRQLITRAHEAGLRIYGATLTPSGNQPPEGQAMRQAVNNFIRGSGEYDGVFDFDAAIRDPNNPTRIAAQYDSGDQLHPNDAGMEAMANSINLEVFRRDAKN